MLFGRCASVSTPQVQRPVFNCERLSIDQRRKALASVLMPQKPLRCRRLLGSASWLEMAPWKDAVPCCPEAPNVSLTHVSLETRRCLYNMV